MHIVSTIVPIFVVIYLGSAASRRGLMPLEFIIFSNRLVFYIGLPALLFKAISTADFDAAFNSTVLYIAVGSEIFIFFASVCAAYFSRMPKMSIGSFIQCSYQGNLGFIGLATAFFYLGDEGLVKAGILTGFLIVLQNALSITALNLFSDAGKENLGLIIGKILVNPIILASIAGILVSVLGVPVPVIIYNTLGIIKDLSLPLALLVIGASLSFNLVRQKFAPTLINCTLKLIIAPGFGMILFKYLNLPPADYLPALILLASPTAFIAFTFAKEMGGDEGLAASIISISTLLSAGTYSVWLSLA